MLSRSLLFLAAFATGLAATSSAQSGVPSGVSRDALRQGFASPPAQARLRCYWWLNGNTTEETITRDLTEMSHKGFGGVLLVDANGSGQNGNANVPAGPLFGSPAWTKLYVHALKTAAALHLEVTLNITSGWNLGGPDVLPVDASKLLTFSRTSVKAGGFDGRLAIPPVKNGFYREIAVLAYPLAHGAALPGRDGDKRAPLTLLRIKSAAAEGDFSMPASEPLLVDAAAVAGEQDTNLANVVDITSQVNAMGDVTWHPPAPGTWEILRIGYTDSDARVSTSSGAWQGLAIDYLDRAAFDTYWAHTVKPLLDASKPYLKTTLVSLATDSWELGGTNWTGRFAEEFRKRRGYDPLRYLPIVAGRIVDDRAISDRFLNDLRRTVGDLTTDHYDHFAERAEEYGLGIQCESGGPHGAPLDALETFRRSAIPQTEYWAQSNEHRSRDEDRYFTKEAASATDIYGKPFAAQEGMTSIGPQWSESLATDLKPSFDQALTEGMTRLVWHEFTSSPKEFGLPGNEYFAGTHLNPNVTWWNQGDAFFSYLNRSQWMMQQGHAVDDVLYFYGDEVPNFVRLKRDDPAHALPGYDYDVTNEDALLRTLSMHDGVIETPTGNTYRMIAMPRGRRLSLPSLERIATYVKQGGNLVGESPLAPTGIVDDAAARRFAELTQAIWGGCSPVSHLYGAGRVFCYFNSHDALRELNVAPDFEDSAASLDYVHRADASRDIYFVRNTSTHALDTIAHFRIAGREPELWNAVDGTTSAILNYGTQDGRTSLPLHLAPYGTAFVVFERADGPHAASTPQVAATLQTLPASQWTIAFQPERGAPAGIQPLAAFTSWTASSDAGVRFFSGTATYRTTVQEKPMEGERTFITLTDLHEICTVRVNGKNVGTIWAMPYRLDITDALSKGSNAIELDVTNLWPNRIIGDAQPDAPKTYTHTNIRKYTSSSPLLPSGLIGTVALERVGGTRVDLRTQIGREAIEVRTLGYTLVTVVELVGNVLSKFGRPHGVLVNSRLVHFL